MIVRRVLETTASWESFKNALRPLGAKAKGDGFEGLVEHYLRLSPIYTSILKHVWHLRDVPGTSISARSDVNLDSACHVK